LSQSTANSSSSSAGATLGKAISSRNKMVERPGRRRRLDGFEARAAAGMLVYAR